MTVSWSNEEYQSRRQRPAASPGWAEARTWPRTGEAIGDEVDMIDDDADELGGN